MGSTHAAALIRGAREDVQLTQTELASAAGIHQPTLAAYESGKRQPSAETLRRILLAARTRPSIPLAIFAAEIRDSAQAHGLDDVRVFGSTLSGADTEHSDIDLLVRTRPGTSIFDLGAFALDVEDLTGFRVDVITETQAANEHFSHVLAEAVRV